MAATRCSPGRLLATLVFTALLALTGLAVGIAYSTSPGPLAEHAIPAPGSVRDSTASQASHAILPVSTSGAEAADPAGLIPAGAETGGIAYDPAQGVLFVSGGQNLSVISQRTGTVVRNISIPWGVGAVAYDPSLGEVFVANQGGANVTVVNATTDVVSGEFDLGSAGSPSSILVSPSNGYLYIGNNLAGVTVVNPSNQSVVTQIYTNGGTDNFPPCSLAYDPLLDEIFAVECGSNDYVYVINTTTNQLGSTLTLVGAQAAAYVTGLGYLLVSQNLPSGPNVTVLDPATGAVHAEFAAPSESQLVPDGLLDISPGSLALALAWNPDADTSELIVANLSDGQLVGDVSLGANEPLGLAFDSATNSAYVAELLGPQGNSGHGGVVVVNLSRPFTDSISSSRSVVDVGQIVWFNTSLGGYTGPAAYAYSAPGGLGCQTSITATLACVPTATGTYWVNATVVVQGQPTLDWSGQSGAETVESALVATLTLSNVSLGLGQALAISGMASGGSRAYTYSYAGLPPGCAFRGQPQFGCIPTESGNYTIVFAVEDSNGQNLSSARTLAVVFNFTAQMPTLVDVGQAFTITVHSDPGFGALTYSYSGLPPGCAGADSSSVSCTPNRTGHFDVTVNVHDGSGDQRTHLYSLDVVTRPNPGFLGFPGSTGYYVLIAGAGGIGTVAVALASRRPNRAGTEVPPAGRSDPILADPDVRSRIQYVQDGDEDPASDLVP